MSVNKPTWWQVVCSVCAAAFGVQNEENRRRDFTAGDPKVYVIVGVIFTTLFVVLLVLVVKFVLSVSG